MADKKTSLIEDIKNYTKDISTNTKQFGPKLPSKDETSEHNEEIEESVGDITTILIGSFAHLIFGQNNKRKFSDLNGLIGGSNSDTLFGNIADIAKTLGAKRGTEAIKFGTQIGNGIAESKNFFTKIENSIKSGVKSGLNDFAADTKPFESINSLCQNIQESIKNSAEQNDKPLVESINSLCQNIQESIKNSANKNDKQKQNQIEVTLKGQVQGVQGIINLLDKLSDEKHKYNEVNIRTKLKFISGLVDKNGQLHQIMMNLKAVGKIANSKDTAQSIAAIKDLIELVINASSISLLKVLKLKKSIFWIRHIILKDLQSLIVDINKWSTKAKSHYDSITAGLKTILAIFEVLDKTVNFGFFKAIRMKINIAFLDSIVNNDLKTLIKHIYELVSDSNLTEIGKYHTRLTTINKFFEFIEKLTDKEAKEKLNNARSTINQLKDLVKNDLQKLLTTIKNLKGKKETQKLNSVAGNIELLNQLFDLLPGFIKLLKISIKLDIMNYAVGVSLAGLVKNINELPDITKKVTYWNKLLSIFNTYLSGIYDAVFMFDGKKFHKEVTQDTMLAIKALVSLIERINSLGDINIDKQVVKSLKDYFVELGKLDFSKLPPLAALEKVLDIQDIINKFNASFDSDNFINEENYKTKIIALEALIQDFSTEDGKIGTQIDKIIDINKKHITQLQNVIEYCDELANLAQKIAIIDWLTSRMAQDPKDSGIVKLASALKVAVDKFNEISLKDEAIKALDEAINNFIKVIVISALILLFAGIIMKFVNIGDIALFTVTLGLFVNITLGIYTFASKFIKGSFEAAKNLAILIGISGFTLAFGAALAMNIPWEALALFIGLESAFVFGLIYIYSKLNENIKSAFEGAENFSILLVTTSILIIMGGALFQLIDWKSAALFAISVAQFIVLFCAALWVPKKLGLYDTSMESLFDFVVLMTATSITVVMGSMLFNLINWGDALKFAGMTALFLAMMIMAVSWPKLLGGALGLFAGKGKIGEKLGLISKGLKGLDPMSTAMAGAKDFAILILACGLTLAIGSYIAQKIPFGDLFKFAANLSLFMVMMLTPLLLTKGSISIAEKSGKEFAKIVIVSAITMMIGGLLFTLFPQLEQGVLEFTLIFGGFMLAMTASLWILSKAVSEKNMKDMYLMMGIVVIGAAILLIAGKIMSSDPNMKDNIWGFTIVMGVLIGGIGLITGLLGKYEECVKKGIPALIAVVVAIGISALAMKKLAETTAIINQGGGMGNFFIACTIMVGVLAVVSVGIAGLAALLGNPVVAEFAYIAIGVVLAGAAAIWVVADAMLKVSYALEKLASIKSFSLKELIDNVSEVIKLTEAFSPLVGKSWQITAVSITLMSLACMMDKMAEAVQNYASLTIPIYKGKDVVGYRNLKEKDFKDAARNVSTIITILGGAVIDAYEKKSEIFNTDLFGRSKFSMVTKSLKTLAPLISAIARAVKTYANLNIGMDYKQDPNTGFLMPTRYEKLTPKHFKEAATNVKEIIITLGAAIVETYDKSPEIFETNFWGRSKFAKVTKSLKTLAPLISSIARSVQNYADLKIEEDWKEQDGKLVPSSYRHLTNKDFTNASTNISTIISVLGGAIMRAYKDHEDYYQTSGGLFGFGESSPFTKTIDANMKLAKLISKIGKAVADMSNLKVATHWYTSGDHIGEPCEYEQLTNKHFKAAAENILTIITTLGKPIEKIAESDKFKLYEEASGYFGFGSTKSKFMQVIDGNTKLAELISKIGKAVANMANLKVATDWYTSGDHIGEPKQYEQLTNQHFKEASKNILTIITTLGKPIEEIAKNPQKMDLYEATSEYFGIRKKKSKFIQVIDGNMKLANLISKIASGIKDVAALKIVTEYDKEGKPKGYVRMEKKHFDDAAKSIDSIITTIGRAVMATYTSNPEWFKNGGDSIFGQACAAISVMGTMIANIASGIAFYADLKIPDWSKGTNPDGTPKAYLELNETIFEKAANSINTIISTVGKTIIAEYDAHPDWYKKGEEGKFAMACVAIAHMGDVIASIASGLTSYAELKIPSGWDPKTGKPTKFEKLKPEDFTKAAGNIGKVISTIGCSIMGLYYGQMWDPKEQTYKPLSSGITADMAKKMFEFDKNKTDDSPFNKIIDSCMNMSEVITSIAEAVQMYASLKMPTGFNPDGSVKGYEKLKPNVFTEAATNIKQIIISIGDALCQTYENRQELFNAPTISIGIDGIFGAEFPTNNPSPIVKVISAALQYGKVISVIAKSVQDFAMLRIPTEFNADGTAKGYQKIGDKLPDYATKIKDLLGNENYGILIMFGNTLDTIYEKHKKLFKNDDVIHNITSAITKMSKVIINIVEGIQGYANLSMPIYDQETGLLTDQRKKMPLSEMKTASTHIAEILLCIGKAIEDVGNDPLFTDKNRSNVIKNISAMYAEITPVIANLATVIESYGCLKMVKKFDPNTGKPTEYAQMEPKDLALAGFNIGLLLTLIGYAITTTVKGNEEIFGPSFGKNVDPTNSPAYRAAMAITEITKPLGTLAEIIAYYAKGEFPFMEGTDKEGRPIMKLFKVSNVWDNVKKNIKQVFKTILDPFKEIMDEYKDSDLFKKEGDTISALYYGETVGEMASEISNIAENISKLAELKIVDNSINLENIKTALQTSFEKLIEIALIFTNPHDNLILSDGKQKPQTVNTSYGFGTFDFSQSKEVQKNIPSGVTLGKYLSEKSDDFSNAATGVISMVEGIDQVFTAIDDVVKAYNKYKTGITKLNEGTIVNDIESSISKFFTLISDIFKTLDYTTSLTGQNSLISFTNFANATKDLEKTTTGIIDIFASIEKIINAYTNEIKNFNTEDFKPLFKILNKLGYSSSIYGFDKEEKSLFISLQDYVNALSKFNPSTIGDLDSKINNIITIFNSLSKILKAYNDNIKNLDINNFDVLFNILSKIGSSSSTFGINTQEKNLFGLLQDYIKALSEFDPSLTTDLDTKINSILTLFSSIDKILKAYTDNIKNLNIDNFNVLFDILNKLAGINSSLGFNGQEKNLFTSLQDYVKSLSEFEQSTINDLDIKTNNIIAIFDSLDNLLEKYNDTLKKFENQNNFVGLENIIKATKKAMTLLWGSTEGTAFGKGFGEYVEEGFVEYLKKADEKIDIVDITSRFKQFNATVAQLVQISKFSEETGEEGYRIIMWGLDGIMSTINVIPPQQNFEHNVNLLSRYVSAINRVDLSKVIKLTNLSNSLNLLATKLGNLDNLTDALANNVAVVLDELVRELLHAEKTIKDAHKLQERRHELINASINKVKEIMDKPMKVEVSKVDDTTSPTSPAVGGGGGSLTSTDTTGGGTSYNTTSTPPSSSTSTSTDKPGVREAHKTIHVDQPNKPIIEELVPDWAYRKLKPTAFNDQIDSEKAKRLK